jgi:hypothetical protein
MLVLTMESTPGSDLAAEEHDRLRVQVSQFLGMPLTQPPPRSPEDGRRPPSMSCALHDALSRLYSPWNEVLYAMEPQLDRFASRLPCTEDSTGHAYPHDSLSPLGCEAQCDTRNTAWYTACGGAKQPWESIKAACRTCALCPDLRSSNTLDRTQQPAPHGGMINGGTTDEAVGLLQKPRQPCVIEHWPGWIEVIHYYSPELRKLEDTVLWMFPASPRRSGLWFPPGRVLVCEDAIDLANYLNFTDFTELYINASLFNAASLPYSYPVFKDFVSRPQNVKATMMQIATLRLSQTVDTVSSNPPWLLACHDPRLPHL